MRLEATAYDVFDDRTGEPSGIRAEWRGWGIWAVTRGREVLSRSGEWTWEPLPSSRTDEFLKQHRFSEQEAKEAAIREAAKARVA